MKINPNLDGIDHINVYSKGRTPLGKWLSNFAYSPIETEDGHFDSVEGYWYWLSCKDEKLRKLFGWQAKSYGREVGGKDCLNEEVFKNKIKSAIKIKIESNVDMKLKLENCKLPLLHYYVYYDKIVKVKSADWIIEYLETFKKENT